MSNIPETRSESAAAPIVSSAERSALRARAHALAPVVMIGDAGVTDAIITETDRALRAHGLIKVRVLGDDRDARAGFAVILTERLGCSLVQSIGKLLVLWRPTEADRAPSARQRQALATPKKLAAVGKTAPRRKPRPASPRTPDTAPPAKKRVAGLARRAGPGIRSARGALDPTAQPRTRTGTQSAATPRPLSAERGRARTTPVDQGGAARSRRSPATLAAGPARSPARAAAPRTLKRNGPPAPRTRAGRSGR